MAGVPDFAAGRHRIAALRHAGPRLARPGAPLAGRARGPRRGQRRRLQQALRREARLGRGPQHLHLLPHRNRLGRRFTPASSCIRSGFQRGLPSCRFFRCRIVFDWILPGLPGFYGF